MMVTLRSQEEDEARPIENLSNHDAMDEDQTQAWLMELIHKWKEEGKGALDVLSVLGNVWNEFRVSLYS